VIISTDLLCQITTKELLQKAGISSRTSAISVSAKAIDNVATQFNRVSQWFYSPNVKLFWQLASFTVQYVLQIHHLDSRVEMIKALILVAKVCLLTVVSLVDV